MATCDICTDTFNKLSRKQVACPVCDKSTCSSCCTRYILNGQQAPHCMHCKKMWTSDFLMKTFTKKFVSGPLLDWMTKAAMEHERSMFPATQQLLEVERLKRVKQKEIDQQDEVIASIRHTLQDAMNYRAFLVAERNNIGREAVPTVQTNTYPCPVADCRGLIAEDKQTCLVCGIRSCNACRKPREQAGHECNRDDVETVRMLKEAHPCPKCNMLIAKVDGCDQMWCMMCHTPFSWATGTIITGRFHNPHHSEWLRQTGQVVRREIGDVPCAGLVAKERLLAHIHAVFSRALPVTNVTNVTNVPTTSKARRLLQRQQERQRVELLSSMSKVWDSVNDLEQRIIPRVQYQGRTNNVYMRLAYLRGTIDHAEFEEVVRKQLKVKVRADVILDLYSSAHLVMIELFRNIAGEANPDAMMQHLINIQTVVGLFNAEADRIANYYKVKVVHLG